MSLAPLDSQSGVGRTALGVDGGAGVMSAPIGSPPAAVPQGAAPGIASTFARRMVALIVALGCMGVLGVALSITPDARGHGTHEQIGLPPCRWVESFGLACPTCGMTTSFAHAVRGNLLASFLTQPMGMVLAILTAAAMFAGLFVAVTGSGLGGLLGRLWTPRILWLAAAMTTLAWMYKILIVREIL